MKKYTYYNLFGINPDAKQDEIRTAFRTAIKKHHPDVNEEDTNTLTRALVDGYKILTDEELHKRYDKMIKEDNIDLFSLFTSLNSILMMWVFWPSFIYKGKNDSTH